MTIKKNAQKFFLSLLLIGIFITSTLIILRKSNYFEVKNILINDKPVSKYIRKIILQDNKSNELYNINLEDIKNKVQSIYSVSSIQVTKKYPDTLYIKILDNNIIGIIENKNIMPKKIVFYGVNKDGEVLRTLTQDEVNKIRTERHYPLIKSNIPLLTRETQKNKVEIIIGKDSELLHILNSLSIMKKIDYVFYKKINSIVLYNESKNNYFVLDDLKTKFYFGKKLSLVKLMKVGSLEEDLTTRISFKKIDLRFNDIVGRN